MSSVTRWFIHNPIAAHLVMLLVFLGGITTLPQLDKEFFPQRKLNQITITVNYPGANPGEVEKQIVLRIEEAIADVNGIEEMRSTAREGQASVVVDIASGEDSQRLLNDIKTRVEGITTFPAETERPLISERLWRSRMISLTLSGELPEAQLKELGETIREELSALPAVSLVELRTPRNDELAIEISEAALRQYGLNFDDVATAVRQTSVTMPGGKIRTDDGDLQIQIRGQAYTAREFEQIPLRSKIDGAQLTVADVATVIDGFEEIDVIGLFDRKPSYSVDVYVTTRPNVLKTSAAVRNYVEQITPTLPPGVELRLWRDMSIPFGERMNTLLSNGFGGLVLVFILLLLFLRPLLAIWVSAGIGVAFLGAIWLLPVLGTSLNMVSLFAFILILGIVVDDAIIVGESIYSAQEQGKPGAEGAWYGTRAVMKPVWFAVISTMLFFVPFYFLPEEAAEPPNLADVVMLALAFSLFESTMILPAHLARMKPEQPGRFAWQRGLGNIRQRFSKGLHAVGDRIYQPLLASCIHRRGITVAGFIALFMIVLSFLIGGWMKASFFPRVPGDHLVANVTLEEGVPFSEVERTMERMIAAAEDIKAELNDNSDLSYAGSIEAAAYNNTVRATLELLNVEQRNQPVQTLRDQWQELIGPLPNAKDVDIAFTIIPLGKAIELQVVADDVERLRETTDAIAAELARYPGVFNVRNSLANPQAEISLDLKPRAESLGIQLRDVARQVRQGFYGEEVQRIPRLREDVRVMVRYPRESRESIHSLRDMKIRTADGREIPFQAVAELDFVDGYTTIDRIDRQRVASVSADLQPGFSAGAVLGALLNDPQWESRFPEATVQKEGEQQQQSEFLDRTAQLMLLSLLLIYGLMAIVFQSYWQPVIIMTAIPFGFMGGLLGHLLLGQELAMFSVLGMVACAGVVVNDNLVLLDRINTLRTEGRDAMDAVLQGARDRFRPIVLTSMTTFIGLTPIMMESSIQAQFLKPMVVALAFGVLTASFITLIFVPCIYLMGDALISRASARLSSTTASSQ
ncbi:multidrug efflux pump subunit AcrB [Litorivivens lipolytica]|uniref:Multidrug efflux pump subunit AcrB n=1 Tax=Litorivivens lipolytica TaxID=1524264 RepID=A0A7W4W5Q0_9GAMM|nr:efflux RND transporter permease subunit [Litorivivens lipolytica]MBB3047947.1 multidrug efflux pump subunit AcrB [Litorivivens lipolytica]